MNIFIILPGHLFENVENLKEMDEIYIVDEYIDEKLDNPIRVKYFRDCLDFYYHYLKKEFKNKNSISICTQIQIKNIDSYSFYSKIKLKNLVVLKYYNLFIIGKSLVHLSDLQYFFLLFRYLYTKLFFFSYKPILRKFLKVN